MLVETIQERMNEWRREVGDPAGAMSLSRDGGGGRNPVCRGRGWL